MKVILASSSPRRQQLLKLVGLDIEVLPPQVDENRIGDEPLPDFLERVAVAKALCVYRKRYYSRPLVAADTIVLLDDRVIGKPRDRQDAADMLGRLSNRRHEVWTGLALLYRGETRFDISRTHVDFKPLNRAEIEHYLDHEHYSDKAGAYAVQGLAALFVERIEGCFFNVMGFPLNLFYRMSRKMGIPLFG